jgi:hypothetical protein
MATEMTQKLNMKEKPQHPRSPHPVNLKIQKILIQTKKHANLLVAIAFSATATAKVNSIGNQ